MKIIKTLDSNFNSDELKNQDGVIFIDKSNTGKDLTLQIGKKLLGSTIQFGKEILTGK